ncbi:MAG TPA: 3-oxoacyl-ACP reductase family protein [Burkholderiaceae bacterium]|nr:3-oxoacyl-ACP reductase family protein [Burkholderiaceae bacterium]
MKQQDNQVAVVTGAANGIGLACARRLAARGFSIAMADLPGDALKQQAVRLREQGAQVLELAGDVGSFPVVQTHFDQVVQRFGRVDVLVNNAGISSPKTILDISEEEWDRTLNINLKGVFNWCKAVAAPMVTQQAGRIINMSSVSAHTGGSPSAVSKVAYCASKAGILGLTRALARELAPHVTVNALCPGSVTTSLTEALIRENHDAITASIPLGRVGQPDDIAAVVEFLATVTPNYLTGEVIDVDGGQWIN